MPAWPFRRRPAPPPVTPPVFNGTFVWESPAYAQRRAERIHEARLDVEAKVAARDEYHPRARGAFDGVVAGQTAGWHLEDDREHDRSLGRLRQMQKAAASARKGAEKRLSEAEDTRDLAWLNWREGYLRLGGDLSDGDEDEAAPDLPAPLPDGRGRPRRQMIEPPSREHETNDDPDNGWVVIPDDPDDADDPPSPEETR
jgi:hypothetical protein